MIINRGYIELIRSCLQSGIAITDRKNFGRCMFFLCSPSTSRPRYHELITMWILKSENKLTLTSISRSNLLEKKNLESSRCVRYRICLSSGKGPIREIERVRSQLICDSLTGTDNTILQCKSSDTFIPFALEFRERQKKPRLYVVVSRAWRFVSLSLLDLQPSREKKKREHVEQQTLHGID